jgi:diguanylate cyclase (GGDEF)-like protein/PAS domain S-box-containing protein
MKDEHKIIIATVAAVMSIWAIDAAFGAFVMHGGKFSDLLLSVRPNQPFFRILLTLSFLAFGIIVARISARRSRAEELLKRHSAAIETSMEGIAIINRDGEYAYVNQAFASINGYADPGELIGKTCEFGFDEQDVEPMEEILPALQKNGAWRGELLAKRKNGSVYFQEASMTMQEDGGRVCIIRDITWRKRHEEWLRRSERFLNTIFNSIHDPFCIFDSHFRIIRANESYAELKNRSVDELIGKKCHKALYNNDSVCEGCVVEKSFHSADPCAKDKIVVLRDGTEMWMELFTYPILDEDGKVSHVMEYTRDVTARKKIEDEKQRLIEKLEYLSRTDVLTGLMNRRALTDSLIYEMDRARRYGSELSIILCDIDNFKEINDTCGHDAGDRALQTIAAALKTILRKADIAGRYGGDEFMLILPETSVKGAEKIADKILAVVRNAEMSFTEDKSVRLSLSIGLSGLEADSDTTDSLIKRTDDAMYASKEGGRDRVSTVKPYPLFP